MFKNNLGYIPKAVESLFTTNSDSIAISVLLAYTFGNIY